MTPSTEVQPARWSTREQRHLLALAGAAVIWRWFLAMRTPVPSEDAASYLWMAGRFAAGDFATPLEEVFPPLLPLLCAPLLALGIGAVVAGQLVCALGAGLAVFPVAALADGLRRGAGLPAAALLVTGSLLARNAAEVNTESPFLLCAALAFWRAGRGRPGWAGVAAGAAAWLRPEALLLPVALLVGHGRAAWRCLPPFALLFAALPLWRGLLGFGFDPLPKWSFHVLRTELPDRGDLLGNLLAVPQGFFQAFGPAAVLLLLAPIRRRVGTHADAPVQTGVAARAAADSGPRTARPLWTFFLLDLLAICTFVVRGRFFLTSAVAVLPLCAAGLLRLPRRFGILVLGLLCAIGMWHGWSAVTAPDRIAERLVGEHLRERLGPGETITGDMQRVFFFAGLRPPPPRHLPPAELVQRARVTGAAFVVLGSGRVGTAEVQRALFPDYAPYRLPDSLAPRAAERGILVLMRN